MKFDTINTVRFCYQTNSPHSVASSPPQRRIPHFENTSLFFWRRGTIFQRSTVGSFGMVPLQFTSVTSVLRHQPTVASLPHVAGIISAFLGPSPNLSLVAASMFDSLALLEHIWKSSCTSTVDRTPWWSLTNFLRSDRHYNEWQFSKALKEAARRGDLHVVEWLCSHLSTCKVSVKVVIAAAEAGHLGILQFLHANDNAPQYERSQSDHQPAEEDPQTGIMVHWGRNDMLSAMENGHTDVVQWLFEHTPQANDTRNLNRVVRCAVNCGDVQLVEWLLERGCPYMPLTAANTGRPRVVQWMLERGDLKDGSVAIAAVMSLALGGHLELMQRVLPFCTCDPTPNSEWEDYWPSLFDETCQYGHLSVVRWILEQPLGSELLLEHFPDAMHDAATDGHLELARYLHAQGFTACSEKTMFLAAANGHLDVVKWLRAAFPDIEFFRKPSIPHIASVPLFSAMDIAAYNGHLDLLQYLHNLDVSMESDMLRERKRRRKADEERDGRRPWATCNAMDGAAERGHLEVAQWLHVNRREGCTLNAIDQAAAHGFVRAVQWLYATFFEGSSVFAMGKAAAEGYLETVQWLHAATAAQCSPDAMDCAAANGHLETVQWLHANRCEGCTSEAMDKAAGNGHLEVVKWLNANRSEGCTTAAMSVAASNGHWEVVQWLHVNRPEVRTDKATELAMVSTNRRARQWLRARILTETPAAVIKWSTLPWQSFDMLLFLHWHDVGAFTSEAVDNIRSLVSRPIDSWLEEHYPISIK